MSMLHTKKLHMHVILISRYQFTLTRTTNLYVPPCSGLLLDNMALVTLQLVCWTIAIFPPSLGARLLSTIHRNMVAMLSLSKGLDIALYFHIHDTLRLIFQIDMIRVDGEVEGGAYRNHILPLHVHLDLCQGILIVCLPWSINCSPGGE